MSTAFLILAHRAPDEVARLVDRLCDGEDSALLHVDRRTELAPFSQALAAPMSSGRLRLARRRRRSRWASFALLDATLDLLEQGLEDTQASHFCLLSGDSYPLAPPKTLRALLDAAGDRSFIFHDDGSQPQRPDRSTNARWYWDGDLRRVTYRHYQVGDRQLHLPNRFMPSFPRLRPPTDLRLLQGSQWWTLSRRAARYVVESFIRRPELRRYFRRVQAPDEWAVPMVLMNSPLRDSVVNEDLHFIRWESWHAAALTAEDVSRAARAPKLFARKLAPGADEVRQALDDLIAARREDDGALLDELNGRLLGR